MLAWRVYYDPAVEKWAGYVTFDSTQGQPEDAYPDGVLAIVQPNVETGRSVSHKWDWYYFNRTEGRWWGGTREGMIYQFKYRAGEVVALKEGGMVANDEWQRIFKTAIADPDFPKRSARDPLETPEH